MRKTPSEASDKVNDDPSCAEACSKVGRTRACDGGGDGLVEKRKGRGTTFKAMRG